MTTFVSVDNYRERALESLASLPPFSPILNRLLAMLGNDEAPFTRLSAQIEKDTVLAGNILKIVNSALYGRTGTVTSVVHAISILGVNRLRNCALSLSVNRLWSKARTPPRWSAARFNLHSLATAMMADRLAECIPTDFAEGAFAGGLFHDLGKLLIAMTSATEYDQLEKRFAESANREECERELLGVTHPELSALALEKWNLPIPIQRAVQAHHSPGSDSLAHVLNLANRVQNELGNSLLRPPVQFQPPERFPYLEAEGLAPERIAELIASLQTELNTVSSIS